MHIHIHIHLHTCPEHCASMHCAHTVMMVAFWSCCLYSVLHVHLLAALPLSCSVVPTVGSWARTSYLSCLGIMPVHMMKHIVTMAVILSITV